MQSENEELAKYKSKGTFFECVSFPGPAVLAMGEISGEMKKFIASIAAGYSHAKNNMEAEVEIDIETAGVRSKIGVKPMDINLLHGFRLDK